jgi:hypothetical protein
LLANQVGQHERAARLAGAEAAWRGKVGGRVPDAFFPYEDPGQGAARHLSDETFQRAWAEGQAMSLVEALAYAREDASAASGLTLLRGASSVGRGGLEPPTGGV